MSIPHVDGLSTRHLGFGASQYGKRPGYYPLVWNIYLPVDTVLPLLREDPGIEIEGKG